MNETDLLKPDDVASFTATIVTLHGKPVGTCLKLSRFSGAAALVHLSPREAGRLVGALREYVETGRHQSLMVRLHNDAALAASLPASHPYNTLLSMTPSFAHDEAGEAKKSTTVVDATFADRGSFFIYRPVFTDGSRAEFALHECVAFNIWGFVTKMVQDSELLFAGGAGGAA